LSTSIGISHCKALIAKISPASYTPRLIPEWISFPSPDECLSPTVISGVDPNETSSSKRSKPEFSSTKMKPFYQHIGTVPELGVVNEAA